MRLAEAVLALPAWGGLAIDTCLSSVAITAKVGPFKQIDCPEVGFPRNPAELRVDGSFD